MEPLKYLASMYLHRNEFEITVGHQPQNALIILTEGSFFCCFSREESFVAKPGDLIFFPMKSNFIRNVLSPCSFYLIYFTLREENNLCKYLPKGKIELDNIERKNSNVSLFAELDNRSDELAVCIKEHILNDIFLEYCRKSTSLNQIDCCLSESVQRVHQFFINNIDKKISLAKIAQIACLSPSALIRHFRKETGYSPIDYLIRLRMMLACNDIVTTTLSIGEISEKYGYDNIYYFSNEFKRIYSVSPTNKRKLSSHNLSEKNIDLEKI